MAKKVRSKTVGRGSDQFMLRLPDGMRAHLADMAARQGRSMNAVIVTSLAIYIAHDGEVDQTTIKSELAEVKQEIKNLREALEAAQPERREESERLRTQSDTIKRHSRALEKRLSIETSEKQKDPPA